MRIRPSDSRVWGGDECHVNPGTALTDHLAGTHTHTHQRVIFSVYRQRGVYPRHTHCLHFLCFLESQINLILLPERAKHTPGEGERQQQQQRRQERKPIKPVRKIHRSASVPEPKASVAIGASSWREGQKVVKMMLGPMPREPRAQSEGRERQTGENRTGV